MPIKENILLRAFCCALSLSAQIAYAGDFKTADLAIEADLVSAQLALSQKDLQAAVNALSDAIKYLPDASDSTVHDMAAVKAQVRDRLARGTSQLDSVGPPPPPSSSKDKREPAKLKARDHRTASLRKVTLRRSREHRQLAHTGHPSR